MSNPLSYEEYKNRVYEIFKKRCLPFLSEKEKVEYLKKNEDVIKDEYKGDLYEFNNFEGFETVFDDRSIYSRVCGVLEDLY